MKKLIFTCSIAAAMCLWSCGGGSSTAKKDRAVNEWDSSSEELVVETEAGKVAGYKEDGINIYKGIPYAEAERFMPPTPVKPWEGVRSSRAYGPTAPQAVRTGWGSDEASYVFNWDDGHPGEDCQRLNIWTPALGEGKKLPVMVWLHGGGYSAGSGQELPSYDGRHLAQKDVVVVSLNHRLNVLGFLDLSAFGEKYAKSGNVGMLDIVAALQWVKNNIAKFGGDPDNVTIFGQSGGGGKVSTLCAMPDAKGLFHKAIVQSGSTLTSMTSEQSRRIGVAILAELGLQPSQIDELAKIPYEQLLAAGTAAVARVKNETEVDGKASNLLFGWSPTVDGVVLPRHPFSPDAPEQSRDIPMMIGTTFTEFAASAYVPEMRNLPEEKVMEMVRQTYGDDTDSFVAAYKKAYPNYKPADLIDTDFMFRSKAIQQGTVKASQGGAPVWMYVFGWQSPVLNGAMRSTHCMEIPFVFDNADVHASMTGGGEDDMKLADRMSDAWVNFARYGNPNGESGIEGVPAWEPFNAENGNTMWWDNECKILQNHDREVIDIAVSKIKTTI